jgi:hypothetical protein
MSYIWGLPDKEAGPPRARSPLGELGRFLLYLLTGKLRP